MAKVTQATKWMDSKDCWAQLTQNDKGGYIGQFKGSSLDQALTAAKELDKLLADYIKSIKKSA